VVLTKFRPFELRALAVAGCWWLVVGGWLLVTGCWLLDAVACSDVCLAAIDPTGVALGKIYTGPLGPWATMEEATCACRQFCKLFRSGLRARVSLVVGGQVNCLRVLLASTLMPAD